MANVQPESKKRALPSWMTAEVAERKSKPIWRPTKRRKTTMETAHASSSLTPIRTVYLMNEAEMVDVALGILVECHKQEKPLERTLLLGADKTQTTQPEAPWTSESGSVGEEVNHASWTSPSSNKEYSTSGHKKSSEDEQDEDALKYVREIFFS